MLGTDLYTELAGSYEVYGADVVRRPKTGNLITADIRDRQAISAVISDVGPDIVIHAAAWTDVDGCEEDPEKAYGVNVEGARNVALACKKSEADLIYISTDFVFDGKKRSPYRETDSPRPLSVYGDSKFKGEEAIQKVFGRYYILRTAWLYGRKGKNFVDTVLAMAGREETLKVVNDQTGSPTYTGDFAKAIRRLIDKVSLQFTVHSSKGYGIYHVTNSGSVSWYEYAKEIVRLAGLKVKVVSISSKELARPARRPAMSVLDNTKFIGFTGHKMRNWKAALKDYMLQRQEVSKCSKN